MRKRGGLDVEAVEVTVEVQKERKRVNGLVDETERRQEVSYEEENKRKSYSSDYCCTGSCGDCSVSDKQYIKTGS